MPTKADIEQIEANAGIREGALENALIVLVCIAFAAALTVTGCLAMACRGGAQ